MNVTIDNGFVIVDGGRGPKGDGVISTFDPNVNGVLNALYLDSQTGEIYIWDGSNYLKNGQIITKENKTIDPIINIKYENENNAENYSVGISYNMENFAKISNDKPLGKFGNWSEYISFNKDVNLPFELGGNLIKNRGFNIMNENPLRPQVYESIEQCWYPKAGSDLWWEWHLESRDVDGDIARPESFAGNYNGQRYQLSHQISEYSIRTTKPESTTQDFWELHKFRDGTKDIFHKNNNRIQSILTDYSLFEKYKTDNSGYFNVIGFKQNRVRIGDQEGCELRTLNFYDSPTCEVTADTKNLYFKDINLFLYSSEGNQRYLTFRNVDNSKRINFNYNGDFLYLENYLGNRPISIHTSAPTHAISISANGNVGIGRSGTSVFDKFEVDGNARIGGYTQLNATFPTDGAGVLAGSMFKGTDGALYYKGNAGTITKIANS